MLLPVPKVGDKLKTVAERMEFWARRPIGTIITIERTPIPPTRAYKMHGEGGDAGIYFSYILPDGRAGASSNPVTDSVLKGLYDAVMCSKHF